MLLQIVIALDQVDGWKEKTDRHKEIIGSRTEGQNSSALKKNRPINPIPTPLARQVFDLSPHFSLSQSSDKLPKKNNRKKTRPLK